MFISQSIVLNVKLTINIKLVVGGRHALFLFKIGVYYIVYFPYIICWGQADFHLNFSSSFSQPWGVGNCFQEKMTDGDLQLRIGDESPSPNRPIRSQKRSQNSHRRRRPPRPLRRRTAASFHWNQHNPRPDHPLSQRAHVGFGLNQHFHCGQGTTAEHTLWRRIYGIGIGDSTATPGGMGGKGGGGGREGGTASPHQKL